MATAADEEPCPTCGGRGWTVESDGGAGTARPCDCRSRSELPRLVELAGVPQRYAGCRLENFQVQVKGAGDSLLRARRLAERYAEEFLGENGRMRESGLLFIGAPGVGKTHLAAALLLDLVRRYRVRGRFVDFTALLYQIQSTFDPGSSDSKQSVLDPVMGAEVLVLDELGAQKPSPWVSEVLYLVLNTRYTRRLPTIFTTNYRLPEDGREGSAAASDLLSGRIPAMLLSRLYEMAQPVVIAADDYRHRVKMYQHQL